MRKSGLGAAGLAVVLCCTIFMEGCSTAWIGEAEEIVAALIPAAANILTLTTLLAAADQALYAAKNSTRNCVKVFEPPQALGRRPFSGNRQRQDRRLCAEFPPAVEGEVRLLAKRL